MYIYNTISYYVPSYTIYMIQILPGGKFLKFSGLRPANFQAGIFLLTVNKDLQNLLYTTIV